MWWLQTRRQLSNNDYDKKGYHTPLSGAMEWRLIRILADKAGGNGKAVAGKTMEEVMEKAVVWGGRTLLPCKQPRREKGVAAHVSRLRGHVPGTAVHGQPWRWRCPPLPGCRHWYAAPRQRWPQRQRRLGNRPEHLAYARVSKYYLP